MTQDIIYNGIKASSLGLLINGEVSIPAPLKNYEEYTIPGRDGTIIEEDGTFENIEIYLEFNYSEYGKWGKKFRDAKKWLFAAGDKILRFSRQNEYFYKVKRVEIETDEREIEHAGNFEVLFICDPYTYLDSGLIPVSSNVLENEYELSHPEYIILGEGVCTLSVNGKSMTANVGQNIRIDTDKMIAYRTDGTLSNTSVSGDYEELYLQKGTNTINISEGFTLEIIPNWRCL